MQRLISVLVVGALSSGAAAQLFVNPTLNAETESRSEAFTAGTPTDVDTDMDSAVSFAGLPISASTSAATPLASATGDGDAAGMLMMNSVYLRAEGTGEANGGSIDSGGTGSGSGTLTFAFDLLQPVSFELEWSTLAEGSNQIGNAFVSLIGPGGVVFSYDESIFGGTMGTESGMLMPGSYTFNLGASGAGFAEKLNSSSSARGFAEATLTVIPGPGVAGVLGLWMLAAGRRRQR